MQWTPEQLQQLTAAYVKAGNAPTKQMVAGGYAPPPATFNPYADPGFIAGAGAVEAGKTNALGEFNYGGARGEQNFGFDIYGNAIRPDQANYNPYSQANILQRNYDIAKRGTTNSYAAQGQLYSGALKNAQATNTYNYNRASDALQRGSLDYYHGLTSNLQNASQSAASSYAQLIQDALNRFITQQGS